MEGIKERGVELSTGWWGKGKWEEKEGEEGEWVFVCGEGRFLFGEPDGVCLWRGVQVESKLDIDVGSVFPKIVISIFYRIPSLLSFLFLFLFFFFISGDTFWLQIVDLSV